MAKLNDVAPSLAAAGITHDQLTEDLRPGESPKPLPPQPVSPTRVRMAYRFAKDGHDDATVMRLSCVPQAVVDLVRGEMRAAVAVLAKGEKIEAAAVASIEPGPIEEPGPMPGEGGP